ncbi:MAG: glycosyltransferase family 4 protein [Candidatus Dormibacteria bacterium]
MRFLMDAHQLGMRQTGNETWSRGVARRLAHELRGHEVHFAVTASAVPLLKTLTDSPYHVVSAHASRRLAIDLPRTVRRVRPQAVLSLYTSIPMAPPTVLAIHDLSPLDSRAAQWWPARFRLRFRATVGLSARAASFVIAPSQFTRNQIIDTYGIDEDRVRVAAIAIDCTLGELIDGGARVEPAVPLVLSVGNVLPRKNLITVARAIRRLREHGLDIRYRIAGQVGSQGVSTERELRRVLPDVEITGYVSTEQLAQHYLSASLLAYPSLYEGYGLPVVEAMRARLPVICSASTSLPEIAAGACAVLDPLDVGAWAAWIESLATNHTAWRRLSRSGLARTNEFDRSETAGVVARALLEAGSAS